MQPAHYIVTMRHDAGRFRVRVFASSPDAAARMVCDAEHAPLRAVVSVKPARTL